MQGLRVGKIDLLFKIIDLVSRRNYDLILITEYLLHYKKFLQPSHKLIIVKSPLPNKDIHKHQRILIISQVERLAHLVPQ